MYMLIKNPTKKPKIINDLHNLKLRSSQTDFGPISCTSSLNQEYLALNMIDIIIYLGFFHPFKCQISW